MVARILGGGKSSRLYKDLVYERRIAQDVAAQQYSLSLGSIFTIEATAKPGVSAEDLEKAIDENLETFRRHGPSDAEVERARNVFESAIIRGLESLGGFGGVADRLNQYNHFLGDPGVSGARSGTLSQHHGHRAAGHGATAVVPQCAGRCPWRPRAKGRGGCSSLDPGRGEHAGTRSARRACRSRIGGGKSPSPGPASPLQLPIPVSFHLENGLTVYLLEQHSLPVVSANLVVLSGSDRNPPDLPGLASFAAEMLDEGTSRRSALQIACDADQLGASLSTGSNMDASVVAFRSLKRNIAAVFELAADVLLNPEFPEGEVERLRHDRLTQILQQRDNPHTLAAKAFFAALYGTHHPYGYIELGTDASNRAIRRQELARFWQDGYSPTVAALIVAGDITEGELRSLAAEHLGSWRGTASTAAPPAVGSSGERRIVIVDKPGSPQTALRVGHIGIARANADYVPVTVMNATLGGLFSSRINMNLREKHGYTYGASSAFLYRRGPGPFLVGTSVRTDVTAPAVSEILNEIEQMRSRDVLPEELATAKDSIARSLPGLFETTPQAASTIGQLFVHDLPADYYRSLPGEIDGVTADDVRRVAGKYLQPGQMIVVAVGDQSKIRE